MKILTAFLALCLLAWGITVYPPEVMTIWWLRNEAINLSGILSFQLMGLIMLLAVRPVWLEKSFGGLDRMYLVHKWAGILAISFGLLHYAIKLSGGLLKQFFERPPRGARVEFWLDFLRSPVKDIAEWSIWLLGIMLVITLWQRFPYSIWRYVHKALAVIFVVLALHAVVLSPVSYWSNPLGWLIGATTLIGVACALISLTGQIGRRRTHRASIQSISQVSDILELECKVKGQWQYQAGQFAFLKFNGIEGAHPFTIASAPNKENTLRISIKALGDYTRQLPELLNVGDAVSIEGPYGCFAMPNEAEQAWIAGGIGITPFLAWLDALKASPEQAPTATLHYCVKNEQDAVYSRKLQEFCQHLPSITLHIHRSEQDARPDMQRLNLQAHNGIWPAIFFCGPQGLASSLLRDLRLAGMPKTHFHQEAFKMR
nr:ferric reductase-like transmembrane domain-containing protein [uncultured Deefgea sp.]